VAVHRRLRLRPRTPIGTSAVIRVRAISRPEGRLAKTPLAIKAVLFKHMAETHANTAGQLRFGLHTDTGPAPKMFPGELAETELNGQ